MNKPLASFNYIYWNGLRNSSEFSLVKDNVKKWAAIVDKKINRLNLPGDNISGKELLQRAKTIKKIAKDMGSSSSAQSKYDIYYEAVKIKQNIDILRKDITIPHKLIKLNNVSESIDRLHSVVFDLTVERKERTKNDPLLNKYRIKKYRNIPHAVNIANFQKVSPALCRGGQPGKTGIHNLIKLGVKSIVNLREENDYKKLIPKWSKVKYFHIPVTDETAPAKEQVYKFLEILKDPKNRPVYVHCWAGMGRTGTFSGAYRLKMENWPLEDVLNEASSYTFAGQLNKKQQEFLKKL